MSEHHHDQAVPRIALVGAAALIVFTITVAAFARHSHLAAQAGISSPAPVESFEARFEDRPGGAVAMLDARTGREVTDVAPGTNGFIRGVLRGMFRTRKLESLGHDATFLLARQQDGRLTLEDLQTGRRVDLDSFGPTNSAAFAGLLSAGRRQR